jgi:Uma2 family endonuclease
MHEAVAARTFADLLEQLGGVPLERIRIPPAPGSATEADVVAARSTPERWLCELVDGVLIQTAPSLRASVMGGVLVRHLLEFVEPHDLGVVLPASGAVRLRPGLVRIPCCSFFYWERFPGCTLPDEEIGSVIPDLVAEVLRPGNTEPEMRRKLGEYFEAGVRLVWALDPATETAVLYTAPQQAVAIPRDGALDGGAVLPGFTLPLEEVFASTARRRKKPS